MRNTLFVSRLRRWVGGWQRVTRSVGSPRTASEFTLEPLEGRILLAADLAGVVQSTTLIDPTASTNQATVQVLNQGAIQLAANLAPRL